MRVRTPTVAALPSIRIRIQSSSKQRIFLSHVGIRGVPRIVSDRRQLVLQGCAGLAESGNWAKNQSLL